MQADSSERTESASRPGEHEGDGRTQQGPPPGEAFRAAARHLGEVKEYFSYYLTTKVDGLRVTARKIGIYAALGVVGFIALAAMIVTASVLVLVGLAQGLGALFGGMMWLGSLVMGLLFFGVLALVVWIGLRRITRSARKQLVLKYEKRQGQERQQYGRDVSQAAAAGGPK